MTTETSNARGGWVLVPREPSVGMWDSAETAMIESELAYNVGEPSARSDAHGFPTMRIWQAVVAYRAMLAAAPPPPAEAQPGWYCAHCQRGVDAREVTYSEQHEVCGRYIANDEPLPDDPRAAAEHAIAEALRRERMAPDDYAPMPDAPAPLENDE